MREYLIGKDERGQRLDKYLKRRLPAAPSSFIYKMLRKKNITLRGKKADGSEKVEEGDSVILYLSDETIGKFSAPDGGKDLSQEVREEEKAFLSLNPLLGKNPILYEDEDVLVVMKPSGVLSQKAAPGDISMNEWLRGYLNKKRKESDVPDSSGTAGFRPSVCNRLDRNTGGILLCAKSLQGSRDLSAAIRDRNVTKTYRMVVHGRLNGGGTIEGDLIKDRGKNQVSIAGHFSAAEKNKKDSGKGDQGERRESGGSGFTLRHAVTVYRVIRAGSRATLVEADLITGRSHQLRVHMASIGHPILFDPKYGDKERDRAISRVLRGIPGAVKTGGQLLWCVKTVFPDQTGSNAGSEVLRKLSGKSFVSPEPAWWHKLCGE